MPGPFDAAPAVFNPLPGETPEAFIARQRAEADAARAAALRSAALRQAPSFAQTMADTDDAILALPGDDPVRQSPSGRMAADRATRSREAVALAERRDRESAARQRTLTLDPSQRFAEADTTYGPGEYSLGRYTSDAIQLADMLGFDDEADQARAALDVYGREYPGLLNERFSPLAFGSRFVPFADELGALASLAENELRPDQPRPGAPGPVLPYSHYRRPTMTYRGEADRIAAETERARELSPRSALAGDIAGQAALAFALPTPRMLTAALPVDATVGQMVTRGAMRGGYEGTALGGIRGTDDSTYRPLASMAEGYDVLTEDPSLENLGRAATGVGSGLYGLGRDALRGAGEFGAIGAAGGAGAGLVQGMARGTLVRPEDIRALQRREADIFDASVAQQASAPDEFALRAQAATPDEYLELPAAMQAEDAGNVFAPGGTPDASLMVPESRRTFSDYVREPIRADPDIMRLRAAGLHTVPQQRAAVATFGPQGISQRMDRYGILREGEIVPEEVVQARAVALRDQAGGRLRAIADQARSDGVTIIGDDIADLFDELGAHYERLPDPDLHAIGADYRQRAALFRNAESIDPDALEAIADDVIDVRGEVLDEVFDADVTELPPDPSMALTPPGAMVPRRPQIRLTGATLAEPNAIPWDDFQETMNAQAGANRGIFRGTLTNPQEAHRAGVTRYRLENQARDRAILDRYGPEALDEYRALRDQFATGATIVPPDGGAGAAGGLPRSAFTSPTLTRSGTMVGGATIGAQVAGVPGAIVGGGIGFALGQRIPAYQWAVLAALNRRGVSLADSALDVAASATPGMRSVIGLRDAIRNRIAVNPEVFGQYAEPLRNAAGAGSIVLYLTELAETDPEAAAAIEEEATSEDAPETTDQWGDLLDADGASTEPPSDDRTDQWGNPIEDDDRGATPPRR